MISGWVTSLEGRENVVSATVGRKRRKMWPVVFFVPAEVRACDVQ